MKYIVMSVKLDDLEMEIPFVFPDMCVHKIMAEAVTPGLLQHWQGAEVKPIAAGFLSSAGLEAKCYGESDSLNLKSREADDMLLIKMADYGSTIVS